MGIFPIWGFQTLAAIGLSFLFRLNKILTVIGSNISFPPFIPFILFGSHWLGAFWLGEKAQVISFDQSISFDMLQSSFQQYFIGACTLATLAAALSGGITYACLKLFRTWKN